MDFLSIAGNITSILSFLDSPPQNNEFDENKIYTENDVAGILAIKLAEELRKNGALSQVIQAYFEEQKQKNEGNIQLEEEWFLDVQNHKLKEEDLQKTIQSLHLKELKQKEEEWHLGELNLEKGKPSMEEHWDLFSAELKQKEVEQVLDEQDNEEESSLGELERREFEGEWRLIDNEQYNRLYEKGLKSEEIIDLLFQQKSDSKPINQELNSSSTEDPVEHPVRFISKVTGFIITLKKNYQDGISFSGISLLGKKIGTCYFTTKTRTICLKFHWGKVDSIVSANGVWTTDMIHSLPGLSAECIDKITEYIKSKD